MVIYRRESWSAGLTLVELLVVLAVLSVLLSVSVAAINPPAIFARVRDVRRITDIAILREAVEEYFVANEALPDQVGVIRQSDTLPAGSSGPLTRSCCGWLQASFDGYLTKLFIDPVNGGDLVYRYRREASTFELDAKLEYYSEKMANDGGSSEGRYELGSDLTIL